VLVLAPPPVMTGIGRLPAQTGAAARWHTTGWPGLTSATGHNGRVWVDIESENGPHLQVCSTHYPVTCKRNACVHLYWGICSRTRIHPRSRLS